MTNQNIFDKCKAMSETILNEINTTPSGWELWLYVRDNEVTWTTETENTIPIGPVFSRWGHQDEEIYWNEFADRLWRDLYNSRGDN